MNQRFAALDGLRGIAALAVVFFHMYPHWAGYLAVDLFFVLSGFILAHVYFFAPARVGMWTFTVQRVARLYPLHIFALFTYICAFTIAHGGLPTHPDGALYVFAQNLTLTNNVGLNPGGLSYNYASWSISVEFWLNIAVFAMLPLILKTSRLIALAAVSFTVLWLASPHLDVTYQNILGVLNAGLIRGLLGFALGILAYKAFRTAQAYLTRRAPLLGMAELITIGLTCIIVFARPEKFSQMDFLAPFLFAVMIPVFACEAGVLSRLFRRISWLGDMSYSVYLNHLTVLLLAKTFLSGLHPVLFITAYVSGVLIYSRLTFLYIEGPARRVIRKFADRPSALQTAT